MQQSDCGNAEQGQHEHANRPVAYEIAKQAHGLACGKIQHVILTGMKNGRTQPTGSDL
jgi:hypothetical protein